MGKLGIAYRVDSQLNRLVVQVVRNAGLCAQHNWYMQQFPEESFLRQQQIVANDEITVVNGERRPEEMGRELQMADTVHLCVLRLPLAEQARPSIAGCGHPLPDAASTAMDEAQPSQAPEL